MPTGYTADIEKGITFQQFILNCARAFGACITMRDDPADKPIPDAFEACDYHTKEIAKERTRLNYLKKITPEQANKKAIAAWKLKLKEFQGYKNEKLALAKKYDAMLQQVNAWDPPTADHQGLKTFMREQIEESIKFDCDSDYYEGELNKLAAEGAWPGSRWLEEQMKKTLDSIAYHTKEHKKEVERAAERTAWVKALRDSIKEL